MVDVRLVVDATLQEAWDVLTDYDNMARFVSGLTRSRIIGRVNGRLEVAQTSRFDFGLFDFKFDSVRDIELVPLQEIRSTLVQGDMKASVFTTRLVTDGGATAIINHGHFIPDRWIPPVIGIAMIRSQIQREFYDLRVEILRRQGRGSRHPIAKAFSGAANQVSARVPVGGTLVPAASVAVVRLGRRCSLGYAQGGCRADGARGFCSRCRGWSGRG